MADTLRADAEFISRGVRCAAWLYRSGSSPGPCVVMAHGFSAVRDQRLDAFAERFAAAGLGCLVFDYRHFGASDGDPRELLDIARQLDDWRAAIAYARSLDWVDADRIGLWGSSFSGGHVVAIAAEDERVRAVVSQVPYTTGVSALRQAGVRQSLRLTAAGLRDASRAVRGREPYYLPAVGPPGALAAMTAAEAQPGFEALTEPGSAWRNRYSARVGLRLAGYRPYSRLQDVAARTLVVVGDDDQTTPPAPAIRAAERAPRAQLVRYPIGHFEIYVGEWFERAVAEQAAFLTTHLLCAPRTFADPRQRGLPARA